MTGDISTIRDIESETCSENVLFFYPDTRKYSGMESYDLTLCVSLERSALRIDPVQRLKVCFQGSGDQLYEKLLWILRECLHDVSLRFSRNQNQEKLFLTPYLLKFCPTFSSKF